MDGKIKWKLKKKRVIWVTHGPKRQEVVAACTGSSLAGPCDKILLASSRVVLEGAGWRVSKQTDMSN